MASTKEVELGSEFLPQFNEAGLITAISQDEKTGQVLMVAYMNREALEETIKTSRAVF